MHKGDMMLEELYSHLDSTQEKEKMGKWMSMKQICEYLGISRDTATKWIKTKGMPAHQIDRIWRFDKEEVDEWMRNNGKSND